MKKILLLFLITVNLCNGAEQALEWPAALNNDLGIEATEALIALLRSSANAQSSQSPASSVTKKNIDAKLVKKLLHEIVI